MRCGWKTTSYIRSKWVTVKATILGSKVCNELHYWLGHPVSKILASKDFLINTAVH